MTLEERIILFSSLGDFILDRNSADELSSWAAQAKNENAWFTEDNVLMALQSIAVNFLNKEELTKYTENIVDVEPKKIGIIAAGNIPAVGFHDILSVLLSGHKALIKLSSNDQVLMRHIIDKLVQFNSIIADNIKIVERLNDAEAYIATGSDNSARYFDHYFGKKPNIIRKNRSSVAVLKGYETEKELRNLGNDIFQFFGLGCRNVAKLYVPKAYKFDTFFESIEYWNTILIHHKYHNNYDYNKSIYLVNGIHHLDNGFLLVTENEGLVSPLSVVFYEEYSDESDLQSKLSKHQEKLQCVIGNDFIPFGQSQIPRINDFADKVNTLNFLQTV